MITTKDWLRSSRCDSGMCVQVRLTDEATVRDSKDPDGPQVRFSRPAWSDFLSDVRAGRFNRPRD